MSINMTENPNTSTKKSEDEGSNTLNPPPQSQQDIYPEVSGRFKGMIIWLGLAFVVMVFLVQHYSGYN
jgi:hypothetical protein